LDLSRDKVTEMFTCEGHARPSYDALTPTVLEKLCERLIDSVTWTTKHPSCGTWLQWMREIGFSSGAPTYDGGWFARHLFDELDKSRRPKEMAQVDELLRPLVKVVTNMTAPYSGQPGEREPWISAVK
jgi:hypothetical protein